MIANLWALLVFKNVRELNFRGPSPIRENHAPRIFGAIRYAIMGKIPTLTSTVVEVTIDLEVM